nr:ABC transporter substrate-binding protein [Cohaesibacter haloalkalitolerans]
MKFKMTILAALMAATSLSVANAADLRMSWWGGNSRHEATQKALTYCGDKLGHTIAPEFTSWTGHLTKVTTQLAGGTEADIMQINWPWLPLFSKDGNGFADINNFKDIIDLTQWSDSELASTSVAGKLQGLPLSITGRVPWFNTTTYEKAGVALPTSWDELEAAAKVFKEKLGDNYYPYEATGLESKGLDARGLIMVYLTQKTGKTMIDPETLALNYSVEDFKAGLEMYGRFADSGVIVPWKTVAAAGANMPLHENPNWADGHIAGTYQWDTTYHKIADPLKEGQELVPTPILKNADATNDGVFRKPSMLFSISKNSKNPKAAAEVMNCLLNDTGAAEILGTTRGIPASKAALNYLMEKGAIEPVLLKAHKLVLDSTGPAISPFFDHPKIIEVYGDALEMFAYGEMSAEEAAVEIHDGMAEILEDLKK